MGLTELLYLQVSSAIDFSNWSLRDMQDRFFHGFHTWLPIISPQHFCEAILDGQDHTPSAYFSVLLLAMYLVVSQPEPDTVRQSTSYLRNLYMTVRSAFTQVQAVACASIPLIQAGTLIAAYEYACGRPNAAYISIGTCARMGGLLGIDQGKARWSEADSKGESTLVKRNVRWGIIMLER